MGDDYVAYMEEFIHEHSDLLNIVLGGQDVVVAYHKDFDSVGMYVNNTGELDRVQRKQRRDEAVQPVQKRMIKEFMGK